MVRRQLEPLADVLERQVVRQVAVDLVGRAEDERRARRVVAGRLQQVERPDGVDAEVGVRVGRSPVVRRLRGGVDDQLERAACLGEHALDAVAVADVEVERTERAAVLLGQPLRGVRGRGRRARRRSRACRSRSRSRRNRARPGGARTRNRSGPRPGDDRYRHRAAGYAVGRATPPQRPPRSRARSP